MTRPTLFEDRDKIVEAMRTGGREAAGAEFLRIVKERQARGMGSERAPREGAERDAGAGALSREQATDRGLVCPLSSVTTEEPMPKAKSYPSLARFLKALGACEVPNNVIGKSPEAAWKAASSSQRSWMRAEVFSNADIPHADSRTECWCCKRVSPAHKALVFAAFRRFQRTGAVIKS
jgi:hypothetical protein